MMQRKIIRTDGSEELLPGPLSLEDLRETIHADSIDFVSLRHLGPYPRWVMAVDDNAWETVTQTRGNVINVIPVRPLKPVNIKATDLYHANCLPGTTHPIAGDVAILLDGDFGGAEDPKADAEMLLGIMEILEGRS